MNMKKLVKVLVAWYILTAYCLMVAIPLGIGYMFDKDFSVPFKETWKKYGKHF